MGGQEQLLVCHWRQGLEPGMLAGLVLLTVFVCWICDFEGPARIFCETCRASGILSGGHRGLGVKLF